MAPSAPLPLPPPVPLTAFLESGDGTVHPSNGNDSPTSKGHIPPVIVTQPKLPGKSVLKRHSMFGSPQNLILQPVPIRHTRSLSGHVEYGLTASNITGKHATGREEPPPKAAAMVGNGVDVVVSTDDYIQYQRKDSRVTWTDSQGKDLAQVWEFEPSETNDSDEESLSETTQSCTCLIQ